MSKKEALKAAVSPAGLGQKKSYAEDFRRAAVRLVTHEQYTLKAAAAAVNVCVQTLRAWHAKYAPPQQTLSGRMLGTIATDDARRRPHELQLDLKLRDQRLNGALYAIGMPDQDEGGAPERRLGNALGYWAELTKAT